jgi:serine/threonine protein phosphatase PrpC
VIRCAGVSDVGQKRTSNEDRWFCLPESGLAVVADGMGGKLFGEIASQMAVDIITHHVRKDLPKSAQKLDRFAQSCMAVNLVDEWIRDANTQIYLKGHTPDGPFGGMGTTLVCVLALDRQMVMAHVGDSRCYRLRKGTLKQLTDDHSLVASQVKSGHLTAAEAREASHKNIITRAIGTAEHVKPDVVTIPVENRDLFLLCSDGLTDMVTDADLARLMGSTRPLQERAQEMVDLANDRGGRDNITAVLVEYRDGS